jgi:hypothetical protein
VDLPGSKVKLARALAYNVRWMAETFGVERLGFLTLTVGEVQTVPRWWDDRRKEWRTEKFIAVVDREEAQRRFNSILNRIRVRYRCGVSVTERHKAGGIHFHLIVVLSFDAKTGFDFAAVKDGDYSSACPELKAEWDWWRDHQEAYGLGRHELLPIRSNGEATGKYIAKYVQKSFENREERDRGARFVRYFGHWCKAERRWLESRLGDGGREMGPGWERSHRPPMSGNHGLCSPAATAWRVRMKQIAAAWNIWIEEAGQAGSRFMDEVNVKVTHGPRWAWSFTKRMRDFVWVEAGRVREAIVEFNRETVELAAAAGRSVRNAWESSMSDWFPWEPRAKVDVEWETARRDNANIKYWHEEEDCRNRRAAHFANLPIFRNGRWCYD